MIDRIFKKKCIIVIYNDDGEKIGDAKSFKQAKRVVYSNLREKQYYVYQIDVEDSVIINQWIFKYMKGGVIFTKKVYSKWAELKSEAKKNQLTINF